MLEKGVLLFKPRDGEVSKSNNCKYILSDK